MQRKSTEDLEEILSSVHSGEINDYFSGQQEELFHDPNPFRQYFLSVLAEKGIRQQQVFLHADFSEKYGYCLLSGEKHTRQRDYILRLCLGGHFNLEETQRALQLYGFSRLYARVPRDAALIVAIENQLYDLNQVNTLLQKNKFEPLRGVQASEISDS